MQGSLRIAHCGGLHSDLNILVQTINVVAKLLGHPIQWDTETVGCDPSLSSIPVLEQRFLHDALSEVRAWLDVPENAGEFLVIYFDDQIDLQAWVRPICLPQSLLSTAPVLQQLLSQTAPFLQLLTFFWALLLPIDHMLFGRPKLLAGQPRRWHTGWVLHRTFPVLINIFEVIHDDPGLEKLMMLNPWAWRIQGCASHKAEVEAFR